MTEGDKVAVAAEFQELNGGVWRSGGDHRVGAGGEDAWRRALAFLAAHAGR